MIFSCNHAEKGGFPRPVRTDETDPIPDPEAERGGGKKSLFSEGFFQPYDFDQDKTIEKIFFSLYITPTFLKPYNQGGSHEKVEIFVDCHCAAGFKHFFGFCPV
jgi:hypothetical protein